MAQTSRAVQPAPLAAPSLVLSLRWWYSKETIPLDMATLKVGEPVRTVETCEVEVFSYNAWCRHIEPMDHGYRLYLEYLPGDNGHLSKDTRFGVTQIEVWREGEDDEYSAMAYFHDDEDPTGEVSGYAYNCEVVMDVEDDATREIVERACRKGQEVFRKLLLKRWEKNGCHVTRERSAQALEAAHIVDATKGGKPSLENGLLLRADIHTLYDKGLISFGKDGLIAVDRSLGSGYQRYRGRRLDPQVVAVVRKALADDRSIKRAAAT